MKTKRTTSEVPTIKPRAPPQSTPPATASRADTQAAPRVATAPRTPTAVTRRQNDGFSTRAPSGATATRNPAAGATRVGASAHDLQAGHAQAGARHDLIHDQARDNADRVFGQAGFGPPSGGPTRGGSGNPAPGAPNGLIGDPPGGLIGSPPGGGATKGPGVPGIVGQPLGPSPIVGKAPNLGDRPTVGGGVQRPDGAHGFAPEIRTSRENGIDLAEIIRRDPDGRITSIETARRRGDEVSYERIDYTDKGQGIRRLFESKGGEQVFRTETFPVRPGQDRQKPPTSDELRTQGRLPNSGVEIREERLKKGPDGTVEQRRVDVGGNGRRSEVETFRPHENGRSAPPRVQAEAKPNLPSFSHDRRVEVERPGQKPYVEESHTWAQDGLRVRTDTPSGERKGFTVVERGNEKSYQAQKFFEGATHAAERVERTQQGQTVSEKIEYVGTDVDQKLLEAKADVETTFHDNGLVQSRKVRGLDSDGVGSKQSYQRLEKQTERGTETQEKVEVMLEFPDERGGAATQWKQARDVRIQNGQHGMSLLSTSEEIWSPGGTHVKAVFDEKGARLYLNGKLLPLDGKTAAGQKTPLPTAALHQLTSEELEMAAHVLSDTAGLMKRYGEDGMGGKASSRATAKEWHAKLAALLKDESAARAAKLAQQGRAGGPLARLVASGNSLLGAVATLNAQAKPSLEVGQPSWSVAPLADKKFAFADKADRIGPYELIQKLGAGGMGEVFLARTIDKNGQEQRTVLKRVLSHLSEDERFLSQFLDEARIVARLDHPNIAKITDLGHQGGTWYFAMEHVNGPDLKKVASRAAQLKKNIPLGIACRIAAEVAAGLAHAHAATDAKGRPLGIVHRDVSPHNILVSYEGAVKLIDFGVAKAQDKLQRTQTGVLLGKIPYMSPEQIDGSPIDHRSDLFSLAAVLWELATGRRLFKGPNEPSTMLLVSECQVERPSRHRPEIPEAFDKIMSKALKRDPDERYQTGGELRRELILFAESARLPTTAADAERFLEALFPERELQQPSPVTPPGGSVMASLPRDTLEMPAARPA